jgi:hypothetical protein
MSHREGAWCTAPDIWWVIHISTFAWLRFRRWQARRRNVTSPSETVGVSHPTRGKKAKTTRGLPVCVGMKDLRYPRSQNARQRNALQKSRGCTQSKIVHPTEQDLSPPPPPQGTNCPCLPIPHPKASHITFYFIGNPSAPHHPSWATNPHEWVDDEISSASRVYVNCDRVSEARPLQQRTDGRI